MLLSKLSLNSLRAFEAVARKKSFSGAASELHVTHAAVSHQIKTLEDHLGVTLLRRNRRSTELTEAGQILFPILKESFARITEALHTVSCYSSSDVLYVSLTQTFATKWLVPRLRYFRQRHPEIELRLDPSLRFVDFSREKYDVAIRCGYGNWPDLVTTFLLPVDLIPVCSPKLLTTGSGLQHVSQLQHYTLFHADVGEHRMGEEWDSWLRVAGVKIDTSRGLTFHDPSLAMQAAIDGLGVAIGYMALAADDIAAGNLVTPFDLRVRSPMSYYVVSPNATADSAKVKKLRNWLLLEANRSNMC